MSQKHFQRSQRSADLSQDGIVLADFCTAGSAPCEAQKQIVDLLGRQYGNRIRFEPVDVNVSQDLAKIHRITSIPTLIFFSNGREIKRLVGLQKAEPLRDAIENTLNSRIQ